MRRGIGCVLILLLLAACADPLGAVGFVGSETPDGQGYDLVGHITVPNPQALAGAVVFSHGWLSRSYSGGIVNYRLTGYASLPDGSSYRTTCTMVAAPLPTPFPPPP